MSDEQELLPGVWADVRSVIHDYCAIDGHAYEYFDAIELGTPPDDILPADILLANNLNGRIQLAEFAAIWERFRGHKEEVREALSGIPQEAQLWSVDEGTLRRGGELLDILCGPRAYGPRITKILHKKRPDLFPIIDSRVLPFLEAEDVVPRVEGRSWADYMVELGRVLGFWLEKNGEVLDEARKPFDSITRLRAYDICLWKHATGGTPASEDRSLVED